MNVEVQLKNGLSTGPVQEEIVLDDDEVMDITPSNGTSNGHTAPSNGTSKAEQVKDVDCIEIDDDEDSKSEIKPKSEKDKKEPELNNYTALLDRLEVYIKEAFEKKDNVDRKLLDALLAAINIQVQREPYSVRKLILEKQLVLPNTISFPPSQVVDMIIEHDPESQLSRIITKIFGDDARPRFSDSEKRERQNMKTQYGAPSMTKMLLEIGQDLVQESTYSDIVHARNLPEIPKNIETYKQVAAQLKPVWENLRDKNQPFKLNIYSCSSCDYKTDSLIQMSVHKQTLHLRDNRRIHCGMCSEYNTNGSRMERHMVEVHALTPLMPEEPPAKIQCTICEENFQFKGQRDLHLKTCKRDYGKIGSIQGGRFTENCSTINKWLWNRPTVDSSIAAQQQDIQKQQQLKQQQQQRQQIAAAARAQQQAAQQAATTSTTATKLLAHQQLQNQIKNLGPGQQSQLEQILKLQGKNNLPPAVLQAVQQQLQKLQAVNVASQLTPQQLQQLQRSIQQQQLRRSLPTTSAKPQPKKPAATNPNLNRTLPSKSAEETNCEICDEKQRSRYEYLTHLKNTHNTFRNRGTLDLESGPPLACSRCRDRFWSYEGLERHLVMNHNLVTSDLLTKAQNKNDGGRCKHCFKSFAFNILQHLATEHNAKLCSAEIMFSCDVCSFKCTSYQSLETHLNQEHPKSGKR